MCESPLPPQTRAKWRPKSPDLLKPRKGPYTNLHHLPKLAPQSVPGAQTCSNRAQLRILISWSPPPPQTRVKWRPTSPDLLKPREAPYTNLHHLPKLAPSGVSGAQTCSNRAQLRIRISTTSPKGPTARAAGQPSAPPFGNRSASPPRPFSPLASPTSLSRELGFRPWFPNSRGLARCLGLLAGADLGPGPGPEESMKVRKYESA